MSWCKRIQILKIIHQRYYSTPTIYNYCDHNYANCLAMDSYKSKLLNNWFNQNKPGYKGNKFSWVRKIIIINTMHIKLPTYLTERIGIYCF